MPGLLGIGGAAHAGDLARIKRLFADVTAIITERDGAQRTVLMWAAIGGSIAMVQYLVLECGASITEVSTAGLNVLHTAAMKGNTALVRWLVEVGGAILQCGNNAGWTAFLLAALEGQYGTAQYLLEEGSASIDEMRNLNGRLIWRVLKMDEVNDAAALSSLLKIMVMLGDASADFIARLSPEDAELATRGRQFRAQLPSYLEQQRAMIVTHCPLPNVLKNLVTAYAVTTPEDRWTNGMRFKAPSAKRPRAVQVMGTHNAVDGAPPLRRSLRLRQKRA